MAPIDDIAKLLREAIADALKDREGELRAIAEAGGSKAGDGVFGGIGDPASVFDLLFTVFAATNPELLPAVAIKDAAVAAGGKFGWATGVGWFLGQMMLQLSTPYLNYVSHLIAAEAQSELWDVNQIAQYVANGLLPAADGRREGHGQGFDDLHMNLMFESATQWPDMLTLLTMRDRSLISESDLDTALKRHGFADEWIPRIKGLSRQLLGPADLALAALRGNLDENTARAYAHILSVTDADFTVLMDNTGEPPGPQELAEALRRGFIDEARFSRGIRQSRVRNEWLDVELALRHVPMTTADAIRATVQNYLSEDQARGIAEQNGLIPDHFTPLLESEGRPLSHEQMLQLFYRGEATEEEVRQAMRESDLKNKYIDKAIALGERLIPERTIVSMVDHGVITHERALELLHKLGFTAADAESLIKLGTAQKATAQKTLSRSDIVAMYTDSLLSRKEAHDHLVKLGYPSDDATAILEIATVKQRAQALRTTERGIEATLKAHHITADEARTQLVKAGVTHEQAVALVDQWTIQRATPTRGLTEAQILKATKAELLSNETCLARLRTLGLAEQDAVILMQLDGLLPGAK